MIALGASKPAFHRPGEAGAVSSIIVDVGVRGYR